MSIVRSLNRGLLSAGMAALMFVNSVGCSSAPSSSPPENTPASQVPPAQLRDGETLFRALFFGQGEVAKTFPEVWQRKVFQSLHDPTPEQTEVMDKVVRTLDTKYPGFFDRFAAEVQSGDHLRVRAIMQEGAADVQALVSSGDLTGTNGECFTYVFIAAAVVVVAAAFIIVVATAQFAVNQTAAVTSNTSFTTNVSCGSSCGAACTCAVASCGNMGAYHGGGGDIGLGDAPAEPPVVDAGAVAANTDRQKESSLMFDEYVDFIAYRLGVAR